MTTGPTPAQALYVEVWAGGRLHCGLASAWGQVVEFVDGRRVEGVVAVRVPAQLKRK